METKKTKLNPEQIRNLTIISIVAGGLTWFFTDSWFSSIICAGIIGWIWTIVLLDNNRKKQTLEEYAAEQALKAAQADKDMQNLDKIKSSQEKIKKAEEMKKQLVPPKSKVDLAKMGERIDYALKGKK